MTPVRQQGPAEAVEGHSDSESESGLQEQNEYCAGVGDEDAKVDSDKQFLKVQLQMRRLELQQAETRLHEEQTRQSHETLKDYKSEAGRAAIEEEQQKLQAALLQCNVEKMRDELQAAEQAAKKFEPPPGLEDSAPPEARLQVRDDGRHMLIVGTGSKPLSMFDSKYWTMVEPRLFPYGDGVFGVLRDVELSFDEWVTYLLNREELDYVGVCGKSHDVNDAAQVCESVRVD